MLPAMHLKKWYAEDMHNAYPFSSISIGQVSALRKVKTGNYLLL